MLSGGSTSQKTREYSMPSWNTNGYSESTPPKLSKIPSYDSTMLTPSPLRRKAVFSNSDDLFEPQSYAADDGEGPVTHGQPVFLPSSTSSPLLTPVKQSHRAVLGIKHLNANSAMGSGAGTKRKSTPSFSNSTVHTPLRPHILTPLGISHASTRPLDPASGATPSFDRLAPLPAPRFTARTPTKAETESHLKRQTKTMTRLKISDLDHSDGDEDDDDYTVLAGKPTRLSAMEKNQSSSLGKARGKEIIKGKGKEEEEVAEAISPGGHITKRRARSRPVSLELLESVKYPSSPKGPITFPSAPIFPSHSRNNSQSSRSRSRTGSNNSSHSSGTGSPIPRRRVTAKPSPFGLMHPAHPSTGGRMPLTRLESAGTLFFGPKVPQPVTGPSPIDTPPRSRTTTGTTFAFPKAVVTQAPTRYHPRPPVAQRHSYAGSSGPACLFGKRPHSPFNSPNPLDSQTWRSSSPSPRSSPFSMPHDEFSETERDDFDDNEDMFFGGAPADSSFMFRVTEGTPSPRKKKTSLSKKFQPRDSGIAMSDYEEEESMDLSYSSSTSLSPASRPNLSVPQLSVSMTSFPGSSTSFNSLYSSADECGLVTPGAGPSKDSGWPDAAIMVAEYYDEHEREKGVGDYIDEDVFEAPHLGSHSHTEGRGEDMDAFILRTLAAGARGQKAPGMNALGDGGKVIGGAVGGNGGKRVVMPGTPVKKVKTTMFERERPWASAVASKVGGLEFDLLAAGGGGGYAAKVPRKSLPAAFPTLGGGCGSMFNRKEDSGRVEVEDDDSDGEDSDASPSWRRWKGSNPGANLGGKSGGYLGLGLGRPSVARRESFKENVRDIAQDGSTMPRTRWLMRRSSSGAFSSGESSLGGTPTKHKDWNMTSLRTQFSPSKNAIKISPARSTSNSSTSSVATLNSPTTRNLPISSRPRRSQAHPPTSASSELARRLSEPSTTCGRFERDFVEIGEIDSGAFGQVIKVRCKNDKEDGVFAVKRSKRFEGARHRLRLREEVDILQHLSRIAATSSPASKGRHTNVLAYIDSWEQDEALFIRTELCELGNFARFLWEFGHAFPRLDEARVWKIIVDLSNGLRFIHDSGVIHLDIKPANIFVTGEGRFKIGDFGLASLWPRPPLLANQGELAGNGGFEREGDKLYLAPEVLQGKYGKAADIFSFGMTLLETAANIIVPDQGDSWHRLRQECFEVVDLDESPELFNLIKSMMRTNPFQRVDIFDIYTHPVVSRARIIMEKLHHEAKRTGASVFAASPLARAGPGFLEEILGRVDDTSMDVSA